MPEERAEPRVSVSIQGRYRTGSGVARDVIGAEKIVDFTPRTPVIAATSASTTPRSLPSEKLGTNSSSGWHERIGTWTA